jgi:hypothetical protein
LDGSTGSSFYNNRDTGESLWGDEFREVDDNKNPPKVERHDADAKTDKHQEVIDHAHV